MNTDWPPERWGCPDWRNQTAYPRNGDDLEDWQWKWEFLRRAGDYRDAYDPWVLAKAGFNFPMGTVPWKIMRQHGMDYLPDPTDAAMEIQNPFTLVGGTIISLPVPEISLSKLKNPTEMELEEAVKLVEYISTLETWGIMQSELKDLPLTVAVFDYSKPINPQLNAVKQQLIEKQQSHFPDLDSFKNRREHWPRHLRVIDAKDQEATHEEIFEHFATEETGGEDGAMDEFYRGFKEPRAVVGQWVKQSKDVMVKASRLL
ncbi:hypothetical protein ACFL1V_01410 [Pseudomonadota bacterium]